MFTDDRPYTDAALRHLESACGLVAVAMETMEPEKLLKMGDHLQAGARIAITTFPPDGAGGNILIRLALVHPEAGELVLHTVEIPAKPRH